MSRRKAGQHQIVAVNKAQDVGVPGHGADGVVFGLAVLAADGQIVRAGNHKAGAVVDILPAVILLRAAAVVLGSAEIDGLCVDDDLRVGANGGEEFVGVGHGNRGFRPIGDGFLRDKAIQGILGDGVALRVNRAAAIGKPAGNQAVLEGVAVQGHEIAKGAEGAGFYPVVPEYVVFQGHTVYAGAPDKVLGLIAVDFAVGDVNIGTVLQIEYLTGFPFLVFSQIVESAVCHTHAVAVHHRDAVVGALVDVTVCNRQIGTVIRINARHAAAIQPHIPDGNALAGHQHHHTPHTGAGFLGMSGGEGGHRDVPAAVQPQNLCVSGGGGENGHTLSRAGDGEIVGQLNHQLIAVKHFVPVAPFVARFPGVGAGGGQVVGARFQPNLPVRADGGNEIIHIGYGVHAVLSRFHLRRHGFGRHCRGYDGSLPSDILRAGRHGQQQKQG